MLDKVAGRLKAVDWKKWFLVLLLFLLAFGVRAHLMKYDLFWGFDPYFHARMGEYVLTHNLQVPATDLGAYFQFWPKGFVLPPQGKILWLAWGVIYKVFTLNAPYDKETWIFFVKLLPALAGAITAAAFFFLGKEFFEEKGEAYGYAAGITMALVAATVPAFVYRTMAGALEDDAFGFMWMAIAMVFLARSLKHFEFNRQTIIDSVLAGLFFGLFALTWDMFLLVPIIMAGYFFFASLKIFAIGKIDGLARFIKNFAISMGVFGAIATFADPDWIQRAYFQVVGVIPDPFDFFVLALFGAITIGFIFMIANAIVKKQHVDEKTAKLIKLGSSALLVVVLLIFSLVFLTVQDFRGTGIIDQTVGEENVGKPFFGEKFNAMILFAAIPLGNNLFLPGLALLLIPLRFYRKREGHLSIILFFWILITMFMAVYKLKYTFSFGLPIALSAGIVTVELMHYVKGWSPNGKKAVLVPVALLLLASVAVSGIFVQDKIPNIETDIGWTEALYWLRDSTPANSKIFNWWDNGHWISFIGERVPLIDGRNADLDASSAFARFTITPDLDEANGIIAKYKPDYILLDDQMFLKGPSFAIYAFGTTNYDDERIIPYRIGNNVSYGCQAQQTQNETRFQCGPANNLGEGQMNGIPTGWIESPNTAQQVPAEAGRNATIPSFAYKDGDNSRLYILAPQMNKSMLARLWFHESEAMKHFEEVYYRDGIKIFRPLKQAS